MNQKSIKQLYTPKSDLKQVVIELAKIIDSIFPNDSKQHIVIQDILIEMNKWGKPKGDKEETHPSLPPVKEGEK